MGKKILLVADQRHERDIIKLALSPLGYTLIESESKRLGTGSNCQSPGYRYDYYRLGI